MALGKVPSSDQQGDDTHHELLTPVLDPNAPTRRKRFWTPSSSARALPACTCCTACAGSAFRRGCSRPAAASAAPGTGTAIRARAATSKACSTRSPSRRNWTRNGTGRRNTRRSLKSSPTPTMSPIASICAGDIVFDTRVTAATFDEDAKLLAGSRPIAATGFWQNSASWRWAACRRRTVRHFAGMEDFRGPIYHTGEWPHRGCRLHRPACRRDRHRLLGDPVDPDHRAAGRTASPCSSARRHGRCRPATKA